MFKRNLKLKVLLSALWGLLGSLELHAAPPQYPAIKEIQGQVWLTGKDGKRISLKRPQVLREKARLETSLNGEVQVQLDPVRSMTLLGAGELMLPIIAWETGEVPIVILKSGQLHWVQTVKEKAPYNVALRSELFEFLAPAGNYVLSMDPLRATAGVKVFEGSMEFSALNGEESATVKAGQHVTFQGVLEGGEIAYDILLQGRKIPRGRLTPVTDIDMKELAKVSEASQLRQKQRALQLKRAEEAKRTSLKQGAICSRPTGRLNECAWVCLNNPKKEKKACLVGSGASCVRYRCNANGEWAEETPLAAEKGGTMCRAQSVVAPCDY